MATTDNPNPAEIPYISSEQEFAAVCELPKAIIYIQVDWSGPERESRAVFQDALQQTDSKGIPVYKIDCTDQQQEYFENWLITQDQHVHLFYTGGYGETIFMQYGIVKDYLNYPGKAGVAATKAKLERWMQP
jgi:hypothetical protein